MNGMPQKGNPMRMRIVCVNVFLNLKKNKFVYINMHQKRIHTHHYAHNTYIWSSILTVLYIVILVDYPTNAGVMFLKDFEFLRF